MTRYPALLVAMLLFLAACEAAIEPPLPHDPEPVPPPTVEWVPVGATILLAVEKGTDEGAYISDEEWLTMIELADDAFRRSYIRVHVVPAHLVDADWPVPVHFTHGDESSPLADANASRVMFFMANWGPWWRRDEQLIALSNTLAHELMHVIDFRYLPNIECEHDPADVPTIYADGVPWEAKISAETTFSEHVRDCFRRGM